MRSLLTARYPLDPPMDATLAEPDEPYAEVADVLLHWWEFSDPWSWGKDGRWRFDPARYPAYLRK